MTINLMQNIINYSHIRQEYLCQRMTLTNEQNVFLADT
jgi:hypothetical protein